MTIEEIEKLLQDLQQKADYMKVPTTTFEIMLVTNLFTDLQISMAHAPKLLSDE
jgi:hypothetical protein